MKVGESSQHALPVLTNNYKEYQLAYGLPDKYEVITKLGRGKYSDVFLGIDSENDTKVVIKILKPIKKEKIKREVMILKYLKEGPNIVQFIDIVRDPASRTPSLIFEYIDSHSNDFKSLYGSFTLQDVRFYFQEILKALEFCHSKGIMHRDIKPQNIIIDHPKHIIKLIDWGLAEIYEPNKDYSVRVASRSFKAPELLVDYPYYTCSLDIWSLGCMLAGLIFRKEPFFQAKDNNEHLIKIAKILGTDELLSYIEKYEITLDNHLYEQLGKHAKKPWKSFINSTNQYLCNDSALDLLSKMLVYDHSTRISAHDALKHPFFTEEGAANTIEKK